MQPRLIDNCFYIVKPTRCTSWVVLNPIVWEPRLTVAVGMRQPHVVGRL